MGTEMMGGLSYLWRSRCLSIAAKVIRREVIAIRLNLKERRLYVRFMEIQKE